MSYLLSEEHNDLLKKGLRTTLNTITTINKAKSKRMSNNTTDTKAPQITDEMVKNFIRKYSFGNTQLNNWEDFKASLSAGGGEKEGGKDWEIVSLKHNGSGTISESTLVNTLVNQKDYNNTPIYSIYSVRRLSDSVVFSLGDRLTNGHYITGFQIPDGMLSVYCGNMGGFSINGIEKKEPAPDPLLITDDGVKLYKEDDICWRIFNNYFIHWFYVRPKPAYVFLKTFSTKELAEAWVKDNPAPDPTEHLFGRVMEELDSIVASGKRIIEEIKNKKS